jgi:hypothetical protein
MFRPRFERVEKADVRERKEVREAERVIMTAEEEEEERRRRQFITDMMNELFKDDFE